MNTVTRATRHSLAGLATAALFIHSGLCAAQTPLARPLAAPSIQARISHSPPNAASVMEASASAQKLIPRPPLVASELAALQPVMISTACFPLNPTYEPHFLLPPGGFSSSPTTPYPQATWPANTNTNEIINYVIERAVINTTSWTTVASTCGGPPSIWQGYASEGALRNGTRSTFFVDSSGGLQPGTTYVYKVTAINQHNQTDWAAFQWTSQQVLPTVQVTNYQHVGNTISFTAAQFYNLAGQVVDPALQLLVAPNNAPAFVVSQGTNPTCKPGSYGLVCQVKMNTATSVALTFQWGLQLPNGFHVYTQSGITMMTP
jgi:hypothetical protein